ncbi:MAG: protein phosphatase 2C domain-containing protein, partial [Polyangiaceae bacterium]
GREREINQDQFFIATLQRRLAVWDTSLPPTSRGWLPPSTDGTLMVVADGMGGTDGGEIASSVAVRSVSEYVCNVMPWVDAKQREMDAAGDSGPVALRATIPGVRTGLHHALVQGDSDVRDAAVSAGGSDMGTTVTLAYLLWPLLYVAHVGDSRCYLLRDGELSQLTTDHTLAEKMKQRTEVEIDESSPWHHILWNALGGGEYAAIEPEVHRHDLQLGDVVLVCSDGLTKHASDEEIVNALRSSGNAAEASARLIAIANADGGTDNTTVVIARCLSSDTSAPVSEVERPVESDAPTQVIGKAYVGDD